MVKNVADLHSSHRGVPENTYRDDFTLPAYITAGYSRETDFHSVLGNNWIFSVDNEFIYGRYGSSNENRAKFWLLRTGIEKKIGQSVCLRCGVIIPIIAKTASLGNIRDDLPGLKIGGAIGMGFTYGNITVDAAVYGDPARSYIEQSARIKGAASLSIQF